MRRQDGDGRTEVLGCLFDFAGEELDLPAQRGEAGGDLAALAVQRGYAAGPMVRLQELLETTSQFASALETVTPRAAQ